MTRFALRDTPLDLGALRARLDSHRAGAILCFEGTVRDHQGGRAVHALAYQAYNELAEGEGEAILAEAMQQHALVATYAEHRVGTLALGEVAVWVGVAAGHRDAAYAASRWIIDALKRRVPIWKKEFYADGESEWLHP